MPCFDQYREKECGITLLFDELWEKSLKRRINLKTQGQKDKVTVANIITHEIGEFMRTFPFHERFKLKPDLKDDGKANAARNRGNERYGPKGITNYAEALWYYNESIAYSTPDSEARALAYANRSAVCLNDCLYKECLENIRLAQASNYPTRLLEKLTQREQHVKRLLEEMERYGQPTQKPPRTPGKFQPRSTGRPTLQLSYDAHANVPHLVSCVELRENDEFGRHLVATRKLKAGDVLMIDTPYASLLYDTFRYDRCAFCHNEESYMLIPCEGCTVAMYCSEECRTKAYQQYHRYECGVLHDCWRIVGDLELGLVGLRTVARAFATHDKDLDGWAEQLNALDHKKVNACTINWKKATDTDIYNTVHVLATNQSQRNPRDLAELVFLTSILHRLMLERTELGKLCEEKPARSKLLFDLLLRHWQTALINKKQVKYIQAAEHEEVWTGCDSWEESCSKYRGKSIGWACYPLLSMLNHSCSSNVGPIYLLDGRCAIVTFRPIAANEQLFDIYGVSSLDHDRTYRMHFLKHNYFFRCRCAACKFNVPYGPAKMSTADLTFFRELHKMGNEEEQLSILLYVMNRPKRQYPKDRMTHLQMRMLYLFRILYSYWVLVNDLGLQRARLYKAGEGVRLI